MAPNENDLEELPDKEVTKNIYNYAQTTQEKRECTPKNKHTDLNEITKSIQNMRIEFNKEIKLWRKKQTKMMLEIKNLVKPNWKLSGDPRQQDTVCKQSSGAWRQGRGTEACGKG